MGYFINWEAEQKQFWKWKYYAIHGRKWRIRKKYQKKINEYTAKHLLIGGNWIYGSGSGLFPIPNPYTSEIDYRSMSEAIRSPTIGARVIEIIPE